MKRRTREGGTPGPARPPELRLARVHLRTGALGLARAELESLAGRGALDPDGVLDLAEARWRTGDLAGSGDAVQAYLATGAGHPLAFLIAAEAAAATGRMEEARSLAARTVEAAGSLDALFAGMPRSPVWPADPARSAQPGRAAAVAQAPARLDDPQDVPRDGSQPSPPGASAIEPEPAPAPEPPALVPDDRVEAGRAALAAGDLDGAALHLALALRLAPVVAPVVLELVPRNASPNLELLRGDAYRLIGHEIEAQAAFAAAAAVTAPVTDARPDVERAGRG